MLTKTVIEPFRIKSVEPIRWTTREQREELLRAVPYNLFLLHADDVLIVFLPDSVTPSRTYSDIGTSFKPTRDGLRNASCSALPARRVTSFRTIPTSIRPEQIG